MLFDCIDVTAPAPAALRQPLPKPTPYGIDLKNPFTMSKTLTVHRTALPLQNSGSVFSSSNWIIARARWWSLSGSNR